MFFCLRKKIKYIIVLCLFGIGFFISCYFQKGDSPSDLCPTIDDMVSAKVNMENACLLEYIMRQRTSKPSTFPYYFGDVPKEMLFEVEDPLKSYKNEFTSPWLEALLAVETLVPKRERRTFFECGALDGITFSTTFHLENFLNWTGILIEADPYYYEKLRRRNRKSFAVHACVSPEKYPMKVSFSHTDGLWMSKAGKYTVYNPGVGKVQSLNISMQNPVTPPNSTSINVLCVPVYSILSALKIFTIDLFILDIEGMELPVLKTLPFENLDISVFLIEINRKFGDWKEYFEFFEKKGYVYHGFYQGGMHPGDVMFIKRSLYDTKKLNLTLVEAYKIITGETDETEIHQNRLSSFSAFFMFSSEYNASTSS